MWLHWLGGLCGRAARPDASSHLFSIFALGKTKLNQKKNYPNKNHKKMCDYIDLKASVDKLPDLTLAVIFFFPIFALAKTIFLR